MFNFHNAVVKDVKWSLQGLSVLSCVYDSSSRLVDIEKGLEIQVFKKDQVVSVIRFRQFHSVKILLFFGMFRDKFHYLIR